MLPELHRAFPHNLAMQSLGSFDSERAREQYRALSTMEGNDIAQVHRYLDQGASFEVCHGPVDMLSSDAVSELESFHPERPVVLAESGAVEPSHSGPSKLYAVDHAGVLLHDILFAPFFAGAAGAGQIWHWDAYVAANDLWYHYGRFAEVVRGLDPPAEDFSNRDAPHDRLRVYTLRGRHTILAWCRDSKNTWESELQNGEKPEAIKGAAVSLAAALEGQDRAFGANLRSLDEPLVGRQGAGRSGRAAGVLTLHRHQDPSGLTIARPYRVATGSGSAHENITPPALVTTYWRPSSSIGYRRALHTRALACVPQRLALCGAERHHIAQRVAGEDQAGFGGQDARSGAVRAKFMAPADLAGLIVDRLQHRFAPHPVIGARPSESRRRPAWRSRSRSWGARRR